jgi:hypothetical protein
VAAHRLGDAAATGVVVGGLLDAALVQVVAVWVPCSTISRFASGNTLTCAGCNPVDHVAPRSSHRGAPARCVLVRWPRHSLCTSHATVPRAHRADPARMIRKVMRGPDGCSPYLARRINPTTAHPSATSIAVM